MGGHIKSVHIERCTVFSFYINLKKILGKSTDPPSACLTPAVSPALQVLLQVIFLIKAVEIPIREKAKVLVILLKVILRFL